METYDYVPGASFATVSTFGAAFVPMTTPRPIVDALWRALASGGDIAEHVRVLVDERMHALTSFAIAQPAGAGWRVIVSGDIEALVMSRASDSRMVRFAAPGAVTWSEQIFEDADVVEFCASGTLTDAPGDGLALANGIALASALRCARVITDPISRELPVEDLQETAIISQTLDYAVADSYPIEIPGLADFDHDGHTLTFEALHSIRDDEDSACDEEVPAPSVSLTFSTGSSVALDRVVIVGRAPRFSEAPEDLESSLAPRLVSVLSPDHEISRSHVAFTSLQGQPLALDLGSTNGTLLTRPGQAPQWLAPHQATAIDVGCRLDLGESCSILVEPFA